jgi:methionine-rich copper-binding protein CopC
VVVLSAFPLLYPPYYDHQSLNPSFADMMEFERETGTLGTTSFGEYLPVWVAWIPSTSPLESLYQSSAEIERLDHSSLPDGTAITSTHYGPTSMTVALDAPQAFEATFHLLYFPTWRAYVDGQEVPVAPTAGLGLVSLSVPAGEHVVHVQVQDMPVHTSSRLLTGASILTLVMVSAVWWLRSRRPGPGATTAPASATEDAAKEPSDKIATVRGVALSTMAVLLLAFKVGYVDNHDTFFKRTFDETTVKAAQTPLQLNFADQVTLMGYDLSSATVQPGDTLEVTLYWKARQNLVDDYSAFVQLVDEEKNIYAQMDSLNPGSYPAHLWEPNEYNRDQHEIHIPLGTPPGEYSLGVGLYNPETMMRLSILEEEGHEAGMYFLEEIAVTRPKSPPAIEDLDMQRQVTVEYENGMTLLGYSAEREYLPLGDFYRLALFWVAETRLSENFSVALRLLDSNGDVVLSRISEPSAGRYPTTAWERGEIVRDNHAIRIPKDLPDGQYRLQLAVFEADGHLVGVQATTDVEMLGGWAELLVLDSVR